MGLARKFLFSVKELFMHLRTQPMSTYSKGNKIRVPNGDNLSMNALPTEVSKTHLVG